jgi:hypothetical protein
MFQLAELKRGLTAKGDMVQGVFVDLWTLRCYCA